MTNVQTKKELIEEFKHVKYILTSSMRTRLILVMYEGPQNLEELRKELTKPSATILHGLKELETINIVKKNQKQYQLTSNGFLLATNLVKLIDNWYSLNKNKKFWNIHDLKDIPDEILKNIYLLKDAQYINSTTSDLSNAFNSYIKLISGARKLRIILPIYSENHLKHIISLLNDNQLKQLELIVSDDIMNSIKRNSYFRKSLVNNKKVSIINIKKNLKLFLTYCDEFMSLTLFFKDGHYDDSQILISKSIESINWASKLYNSITIEANKNG